jgi:large conductance mechanosensitive channel protein
MNQSDMIDAWYLLQYDYSYFNARVLLQIHPCYPTILLEVVRMSNNEMLEELREIRKLLTPPPAPPAPKGLLNEFIAFISVYKVLGLAVAFILGIYIGAIIQALVNNLIMPLIQFALPGIGGAGLTYELAAGPIVNSIITFIIVAFVVFIIVKIASRLGIK